MAKIGDKWHDDKTWYTYKLIKVEYTSLLENGYEVLEESDNLSELLKNFIKGGRE